MKQSCIGGWLLVALCSLGVALPASAQQGPRQERAFVFGGSGSRIGISVRDLRDADVSAARLARPEGVVVDAVQPGTPAERAGVKSGDIVLEIDGERVRGARHFSRLVQESPAGRAVQLVINRSGARQTLSVTPEEGALGSLDLDELRNRIAQRMGNLPPDMGPRAGTGRIGLTLMPLSAQLAAHFGVRAGVLVSEVVADSPAAQAGVKAGDIITSVNGRAVGSPMEVSERLRAIDPGATVELTLSRDKQEVRARVRLGEGRRPRDRDAIGI